MLYTLEEMVGAVRYYLDEPTEGFWKDLEIVQRLSDSSKRVARIVSKQDPTFFVATTNISFVANQALYDLPRNARPPSKWDHAVKNNASGDIEAFVFDMRLRDHVIGDQLVVGNNSLAFSISYQGPQLRISPIPTAALSSAITLFYIPVFGNLHAGTVNAATSTTITFPATPTWKDQIGVSITDDDYIGMEVVITSGTGIGERKKITDYTGGSTRQATVESAWTSTPDTDSTYSIVSPIPDDFHDVVCLDAAVALAGKSPRRRMQQWTALLKDRQDEMVGWVDQRQIFRSERVEPDLSAGVY